jgi:Domain of unknown function (DUF4263)
VLCGGQLARPAVIHAQRDCEICGRSVFKLPGDDGLKIEAGESVVVPPGAIKMSLDVSQSTGQFTFAGVSVFVQMLLGEQAAGESGKIVESLQEMYEAGDAFLEASSLLSDLDQDSEEGAKAGIVRLEENRDTPEWLAFLKAGFARIAAEAIAEGDAERAAWGAQQSMLAHAGLVFERDLKPRIWRGYGNVGADQIGEALELWEQNKDNADEDFWQRELTARPFLLNQLLGASVVIHKDKAYVGGKGVSDIGGKYADFLLSHEILDNVTLVEIKTPETQLLQSWPYRMGVYGASSHLSGGLTQLSVQRHKLITSYPTLKLEEPSLTVLNPRCVLLSGSVERELDAADKRESFELFRNGLRDVDVVTYDELFARARALREVLAGTSRALASE